MRLTRLFGMMALVSLLAAGCSTTKVAMKRMCESSGGTYAGGTCTPGKAVKAQEMCFAAGGNYNSGDDTCDMGDVRSK